MHIYQGILTGLEAGLKYKFFQWLSVPKNVFSIRNMKFEMCVKAEADLWTI